MPDFDGRRCPACGSLDTFWRHGVHFDQERRCYRCGRHYDPDDEREKWLAEEAERLKLVTHRE